MYEGELTSKERELLANEHLPTDDSELREWVTEDDDVNTVNTLRRHHNRPTDWRVSVYTGRGKWTTLVTLGGGSNGGHITTDQPHCNLMCRATDREWEIKWRDVPQRINSQIGVQCELLFEQEVKE